MKIRVFPRLSNYALPILLAGVLLLPQRARPAVAGESADDEHHARVVGGYFEEWSIYFAGFNVANLQANGVADKLTHLTYAFGDATPTRCAIADSWADYQDPNLPSVSGAPVHRAALRQFCCAPTTEATPSQSQSPHLSPEQRCKSRLFCRRKHRLGARSLCRELH